MMSNKCQQTFIESLLYTGRDAEFQSCRRETRLALGELPGQKMGVHVGRQAPPRFAEGSTKAARVVEARAALEAEGARWTERAASGPQRTALSTAVP